VRDIKSIAYGVGAVNVGFVGGNLFPECFWIFVSMFVLFDVVSWEGIYFPNVLILVSMLILLEGCGFVGGNLLPECFDFGVSENNQRPVRCGI